MRRTETYAAMTKDETQRHRWTFCEAVSPENKGRIPYARRVDKNHSPPPISPVCCEQNLMASHAYLLDNCRRASILFTA
jgi:hypothetical protein